MNLNPFNTTNLFEAATNLFQQLNIKLNSNTAKPVPTKGILEHQYKDNDTFNAVDKTYFLGIIDESIFTSMGNGNKSYSYQEALEQGDKNYKGLMLFALELKKHPTRTEISELTRAFNRISQKMPVALLLKYTIDGEAVISIAISERFKYLQNWRLGEKAGKVIILRDIYTQNTHAGHLRILQDLVKPVGISTYEQLHQHWLQVLDVNILNKKFFQELSNWYFAAMNEVSFPDDLEKNKEIRNATNLIRLITRIIFIWFIKEKQLVPDYLFNNKSVARILKDFNKTRQSHNYYNAILQNLFFGTLNQKMGERKFAKDRDFKTNKGEYGVKNLFRYADLFTISENEILELFKDVPFLNGGLFDCLDKSNDENRIEYVDGFSRNPRKKAIVPDYIFFGEWEDDLTKFYDPKAKRNNRSKIKGLINILASYKFTVAENTPLEEEIALDPELLGKVFENLLANYNPETQTTARKQTGSFYTPREIVNYMVDESLLEYLKQNAKNNSKDFESRLRDLLSYSENHNPFNETETRALIEAINNCKILDPACGSGAFPMGILHKMVHLLQKLDPENKYWKEAQREKIIGDEIKKLEQDKKAIEGLSDKQVREKALQAVKQRLDELEDIFNKSYNFDDYSRKLYLIENCIYGIDIQPIAVQIAKLRFFISLVIDQKVNKSKENFGIRSLPNLETKFVAANTLIGLEIPTNDLFSENDPLKKLENELKTVRHEYFTASNRRQKLILQQRDKELCKKIADLISDTLINEKEGKIKTFEKQLAEAKKKLLQIETEPEQIETDESGNLFGDIKTTVIDKKKEKIKAQTAVVSNIEKLITSLKAIDDKDTIQKVAEQIASFDPYDQNHFADWFDPEWMFGITDGFDIAIGNPPYVSTKGVDDAFKKQLEKHYGFADDLYNHFYFKSIELLKQNGILAFISSKTFWTIQTKKNLRDLILKNQLLCLFDTANPFESAMVDTCVTLIRKNADAANYTFAFLDGTKDLQNPQITIGNIDYYRHSPNQVFFPITDYNLKIFEKYGKKVNELLNKWWDKISTSKNIEKYKRELTQYRNALKPGDITLLGLITEGGVGIQTGNNGKYVGVLEGTKWADNVRKQRPEKLLLATAFCRKNNINNKQAAQRFLDTLSEHEIRKLFDDLKEKYGRDVFGQGWLYRIVSPDEIADVDSLTEDEKLNGIKGSRTFVPYDKGDKDGNRWYAPTPYYIDWSRENVKVLQTDPKARWQGYQFYFREGFCWNNVLSDEKIKCRMKEKSVHSTEAMTFISLLENILPNYYLVCMLNSTFYGQYRILFINTSHHLTTGDAKEFPIIIPDETQLKAFESIFNHAVEIQKQKFAGKISDQEAEGRLNEVQKELDKVVAEIY